MLHLWGDKSFKLGHTFHKRWFGTGVSFMYPSDVRAHASATGSKKGLLNGHRKIFPPAFFFGTQHLLDKQVVGS